ncbi:MAG: AlpA family phage regulatory protein [Burkholderiales bacterium]|nr:AlpA family phage regulatory protein [Burkholderiales bacterium]
MASRVIRLKELIKHTGLSRSAIYDRMDAKSPRHDPSFPRSFSLGGAAVGWYLEEVDRWLQGCATPGSQQPPTRNAAQTAPVLPRVTRSALASSGALAGSPDVQPAVTNLAEALLVGGQLNSRLMGYMRMTTWSSAMAALIVSGVEPPPHCDGIPDGGTGLDGKHLHPSDGRLHDARRILRAWNAVDADEGEAARSSTVTPAEFLEWCVEEPRTHGDWLRYLLELAGFKDSGTPDFAAARLEDALRKVRF